MKVKQFLFQVFAARKEVTDNVHDLTVLNLQLVLRHGRVAAGILKTKVLGPRTFLPKYSVKLLDKKAVRSNQDPWTISGGEPRLRHELWQELVRDPRPEVHHGLPALRDPPGQQGPVGDVVLNKSLGHDQLHAEFWILLEDSKESFPRRLPLVHLEVLLEAGHG